MTTDSVKTAVLDRVRQKNDALLKEAKAEAKRILNNAQSELTQREETLHNNSRELETKATKQTSFRIEMENKKSMLLLKKALVDEVFSELTKQIEKLSAEKQKEYINILQKRVEKQLDVATFYCRKEECSVLPNAKEQPMLGGLIAENSSGTERIDYRYERLLEELRNKSEGALIKELFGP